MCPDALLLTTFPSFSCFPRSLLSSSFLPSHFLVAVDEILKSTFRKGRVVWAQPWSYSPSWRQGRYGNRSVIQRITWHPQSGMLGLHSLSLVYPVLDPRQWTGATHSHGGSSHLEYLNRNSLRDTPRELSVSRELIGLFSNKICTTFKKI